MRLIFDALKMVPCNPTFIDIRNAIIAADGGANECALWEIFARRGFGFFASAGSLAEADDFTEDFEVMPTCIPTLKIEKDITSLVTPGDPITVTFDIANHTPETANDVIVTDVIADGLTLLEAPAGISFTQSGNEIIFDIGDMATLEEGLSVSYTHLTLPTIYSV